MALYAATCLRREFTGTISDAAIYLVLADHFSPYRALAPDLGTFAFSRYPFPPLYPLVLAGFGGGSTAPLASYVCGAVTLGAAIGLYHLWLRTEGLRVLPAALLAALFALLPTTLLIALDVVSEPLYLALTLAGLILLAAPPGRRTGALAALAFGLAACTRTAGITLLAAFAISWPLRTRGTLGWWPPLLAALPPALWQITKRLSGFSGGYAPFSTGTGETFIQDLPRLLSVNLRALADGAVTSFDLWSRPHVVMVVAGFGIMAAMGWMFALRRRDCAALYIVAYFGMILLWPHPAHARRFLFVVLPLLMAYSVIAVSRAAARREAVGGGFAIVLLVLSAGPSCQYMLSLLTSGVPERRSPEWFRIAKPDEARRAAQTNARMFRFVGEAASQLPPEACVSAALPQYVLLYGHRRAEQLPPESAGQAALATALERCPYVVMMGVADYPATGNSPMYPFAWIKDRMQVLGVEYLHPGERQGTVLAMLARVGRAGEGR
jgi:hypothetical protein